MTDQTSRTNSCSIWRIILWSLIAIYTFLLPNAIYIYRAIEEEYGLGFAGKIPFVIVLVFGAAYIAYLHFAKLGWKKLLYLVPSAVIALTIFKLEGNPNKHIHIPEYVVLAWLVYAALSRDYRGRGMLILVFILTSLLGVVDELEQGIHPGRSYGWSDMLVNSASALIGVFTILGLTNFNKIGGGWVRNLKK
jgi:VanZ family protein